MNTLASEMTAAEPEILLVEDSADNRLLITHILRRAGLEIQTAVNGEDGVQKALQTKPRVILMDMQMPILDGLHATEQLRREGFDNPIIALTAHSQADDRKAILTAGCNAHLTKPVNFELLIRTIKNYLAS